VNRTLSKAVALAEAFAGCGPLIVSAYRELADLATGYDVVVNATPLGMKDGDPLPLDVSRIAPGTFVGEVVMKEEYTPFLRQAMQRGCPVQVGTDMLYEMIPAYLEFFGFPTTTPERLRALSQIRY